MPAAGVDDSIPLQAGQIPLTFNALFNPQRLMEEQLTAQKLRLLGQQQQGRNALRQLYADPANLNPQGEPTPQAWQRLMAAAPEEGLDLRAALTRDDSAQARMQLLRAKIGDENLREQYMIGQAGLSAFRNAPPNMSYQQRLAAGQEAYTEALDVYGKSGAASPDTVAALPKNFDPARAARSEAAYNAMILGPKGELQAAKTQAQIGNIADEIRQRGYRLTTERMPDGSARQIYTAPGKQPLDLAGNPVEPTGVPAGKRELSPSKEIAVVDKDGNVVERVAAREGVDKPGWFRGDTGDPIKVPEGGHIDVGQTAAPIMGSRESVYQQRVLNAARTATTNLEAFTKMPATVTSGFLGMGTQRVGLLDAPRAMLAQGLSGKDVQIYNTAMAGMNRALAQIETAGLAPGAHFAEQFDTLTLKPTDKLETKLYKLADARQIIENGMNIFLANPRVAPEQKKAAEGMIGEVQKAVPWTIFDVLNLQNSTDPKATLKSVGVSRVGGKEETPPAAEPPSAPSSGVVPGNEGDQPSEPPPNFSGTNPSGGPAGMGPAGIRPPGVPAGAKLQTNPSTGAYRWLAPDGKAYDAQGKPM